MHEFVKKTMEIAMDDERRIPFAKNLIVKGCEQGIVLHHQLLLGLKRLYQGLSDLVLDVPRAEQYADEMKMHFVTKGLIKEDEL